MSQMFDLSITFRFIYSGILFLLLLVQVYLVVAFFYVTRTIRYILVPFFGILLVSFVLIFLPPTSGGEVSGFFIPRLAAILFPFVLLAFDGWTIFRLQKKARTELTPVSIQRGIDNLPSGICFSLANGQPLLVNSKMNELCQEITGRCFSNANQFWAFLTENKEAVCTPEPGGKQAISIQLPDRHFWTFTQEIVSLQRESVVQIIAVDTTKLHQIGMEEQEKNQHLLEMNMRLQYYNENIERITHEEEILAAKVNIHDQLGQVLLASKFYLTQIGSEIKPQNLLHQWRQNIALLRQEAVLDNRVNPLEQIEDAAAAVGMVVKLEGEMPQDDFNAMQLIFAATRECLANAVRHAEANEMTLHIAKDEKKYIIVFTNNGKIPDGNIQEGGGLSSLRRRIERAGGDMRIDIAPVFALVLEIPRK